MEHLVDVVAQLGHEWIRYLYFSRLLSAVEDVFFGALFFVLLICIIKLLRDT